MPAVGSGQLTCKALASLATVPVVTSSPSKKNSPKKKTGGIAGEKCVDDKRLRNTLNKLNVSPVQDVVEVHIPPDHIIMKNQYF